MLGERPLPELKIEETLSLSGVEIDGLEVAEAMRDSFDGNWYLEMVMVAPAAEGLDAAPTISEIHAEKRSTAEANREKGKGKGQHK